MYRSTWYNRYSIGHYSTNFLFTSLLLTSCTPCTPVAVLNYCTHSIPVLLYPCYPVPLYLLYSVYACTRYCISLCSYTPSFDGSVYSPGRLPACRLMGQCYTRVRSSAGPFVGLFVGGSVVESGWSVGRRQVDGGELAGAVLRSSGGVRALGRRGCQGK